MGEGEPLTGDGVTQGIVRIGDTVRRPLRPFSLTVQAYLAHLRDAGFTGAPLPLGVDERGREVLSFVHGDVPRNPLPPETAGDDVLVALARLIRALHEASAGWVPPPGAVWGGTPANAGRIAKQAELVSHRDYYPGNVVFRGGLPVALIDFDLAMPTTGSTTSRTRCGTGRRCAIRGTGRPRSWTPTSPTGSQCSRTPTA